MITHASALEAFQHEFAADAFDTVACLVLLDHNRNQREQGLPGPLKFWHTIADDGMGDGRIAGVTERAVQETMDL